MGWMILATLQHFLLTLAAAGLDASCLLILGADVGTTFCMDLGGVAGGGVATGADYIIQSNGHNNNNVACNIGTKIGH